MLRRTVAFMLILSGTDTCNTVGISASLTGRYIEHMLQGNMRPFVRHSGDQADQTVVNVCLLRQYVSLVKGTTRKKYATAREAEVFYVLRPTWTLEYLLGNKPSEILTEQALEEDSRYFPYAGCSDVDEFYITDTNPFVKGRDNKFLMINIPDIRKVTSLYILQGSHLLKYELPKRTIIRRPRNPAPAAANAPSAAARKRSSPLFTGRPRGKKYRGDSHT
jgi:hypothetical protein